MEQNVQWKQISMTYEIHACRSGWLGVWDAIIAALTGKDRLIAPRQYTVETWVGMPPDRWHLSATEPLARAHDHYIDGVKVTT